MTTRASLGNVSVGVVIGLVLGVALYQTVGLNFVGAIHAEVITCDMRDGEGCDCDSGAFPAQGTCTDGICVDCEIDPPALCCDAATNTCVKTQSGVHSCDDPDNTCTSTCGCDCAGASECDICLCNEDGDPLACDPVCGVVTSE